MATPFQGRLDGTDGGTPAKVRIRLDADTADLLVGGGGRGGDIKLRDDKDVTKIRFDAAGVEGMPIFPSPVVEAITETILLSGDTGTINVGGQGQNGSLQVKGRNGEHRILLSGNGDVHVGGNDADGHITLYSEAGERIHLDAGDGDIWLGGHNVNGDLLLLPAGFEGSHDRKKATIWLDGGESKIRLRSSDLKDRIQLNGPRGKILLGGNGEGGDLLLFDSNGDNQATDKATVWLNAGESSIRLRGREADATDDPKERIHLDGDEGNIWLGGNGKDGDLLLFPGATKDSDRHDTSKASIWLNSDTGNILLRHLDDEGKLVNRIHLLAESGDIVLQNADCAEDFDISESEEVEPGTVMVLGLEGKLKQSTEVYDKKVAGVISGAGDFRPGIILDKNESQNKRLPLALVGKVYCKVDAQYSPIEVGDLLTTSPTVGHAMKASDPLKAFGAVIGKALRSLEAGQGLIPILIALQ